MEALNERLDSLTRYIEQEIAAILSEDRQNVGVVIKWKDSFNTSVDEKFRALQNQLCPPQSQNDNALPDDNSSEHQDNNYVDEVLSNLQRDVSVLEAERASRNAEDQENRDGQESQADAGANRKAGMQNSNKEHRNEDNARDEEVLLRDSITVSSEARSLRPRSTQNGHQQLDAEDRDGNSDRTMTEAINLGFKNPKTGSTSTTTTPSSVARGKRANHTVLETPKKRAKKDSESTAPLNNQSARPPFKELSLPKDFHQPEAIYKSLCDRSPSTDPPSIWLLTRLFFAVASPTAFENVRELCRLTRKSEPMPGAQSSKSLYGTIQALDQLDKHSLLTSVLRRYYLVSLKTYRKKLEQEQSANSSIRTRSIDKPSVEETDMVETTYSRADTQALVQMMKEAYPDIEPTKRGKGAAKDSFNKRLGYLKERLRSGRNWDLLQTRFSLAILLLIPNGGEYQINDSDIERLSMPLMSLLLDILSERRGQFIRTVCESLSQMLPAITGSEHFGHKFKFETNDVSMKGEAPDSQRFIELCEIELD